jgi:hypothetical protein
LPENFIKTTTSEQKIPVNFENPLNNNYNYNLYRRNTSTNNSNNIIIQKKMNITFNKSGGTYNTTMLAILNQSLALIKHK